MAFLETRPKSTLPENAKKAAEEDEIKALVKARGFEPGVYKFEPNPNVSRRDGSIISGAVKGSFTVSENDVKMIILEREDFPERIWKKICAKMGYKYHVHTDIDKFTIIPNCLEVTISLVTPINDDT